MKLFFRTLTIIILVAILPGCASIVSKSNWPVSVNTTPVGAQIQITDKNNSVVFSGKTPVMVSLKSGAGFFAKQSYRVKITMDGYSEKIIPIECKVNGWYFGNILFGGVIGLLIVDPATGAMYKIDQEFINETLTKSVVDNEQNLKIMNINDLSDSMKKHLVSID